MKKHRMDWLAGAINNLGGINSAAAALGISRARLLRYIVDGLAKMPFGLVGKLSELSNVPVECLQQRIGPMLSRRLPKWLRDEAAASQHRAA